VDLYTHSPMRLQGIVLNWLRTGTNLPLPYVILLNISRNIARNVRNVVTNVRPI
jgi:hypothetical protein